MVLNKGRRKGRCGVVNSTGMDDTGRPSNVTFNKPNNKNIPEIEDPQSPTASRKVVHRGVCDERETFSTEEEGER